MRLYRVKMCWSESWCIVGSPYHVTNFCSVHRYRCFVRIEAVTYFRTVPYANREFITKRSSDTQNSKSEGSHGKKNLVAQVFKHTASSPLRTFTITITITITQHFTVNSFSSSALTDVTSDEAYDSQWRARYLLQSTDWMYSLAMRSLRLYRTFQLR